MVIACVCAAVVFACASPAAAEGSRTWYPTNATCQPNSASGSCRANIEWRTSAYGPAGSTQVRRRTIFQAYAQSGETILVGSSAVAVGSGDITVFNPGVVTDPNAQPLPAVTTGSNGFKCSDQRISSGIAAQGRITSRALEVAGPQAVSGGGNPGGFVPCHYTAPSTGIYSIVFYGPNGDGVDTDGGALADINLANANNFNASQLATVAAWDVTIRADDTSVTDIDGRVFTTALAASTAGNGRPLNMTFYVTTGDGFRYQVQTRGLDPNGFALYANQLGFVDADGNGPLDHDLLGTTNSSQLTGLAGNATLAAPQYPISFAPLAPETLAALGIPTTPVAPALSALSFVGNVAGNTSAIGQGGTFHYTSSVGGVAEIIVSRDGVNFDPGNPLNRVLRDDNTAGAHTLTWDGKDNSGNDWPIGANYAVRTALHAGEYHFPLLDAENSTLGGPTITLQNPPGGTCPFGNASCTTAFYDDRGYHTSGPTGSDVGTPGAVLCGTSPPATDHSDPVTGYDSSGGQRAYGVDNGGNTNVPCTGSFGDVKALDTWTYFPSTVSNAQLNIINTPPPAPVANDDSYNVSYETPRSVAAAGVLVNDTGATITVTANTNPAHGSVTQNADGSLTYTPASGFAGNDTYSYTITDSFGRTATANVGLIVAPPAAPVANDDSYNVSYETPRTVAAVGVLGNDSGTTITVTAHTNPAHGTVTQNANGSLTYTPAFGFTGNDAYSYTITDGFARTSTANVSLVVAPPAAPVANDDSYNVSYETPRTVAAAGVLGNDTGTTITVTAHTNPAHGTVTQSANGSFTYTPAAGFAGTDTYSYTITDALARTSTATVTLVVPMPPAPVASHDTFETTFDTPLTSASGVLGNDTGSTITVTAHTKPAHGSLVQDPNGTFTYTPAHGYSGADTYSYTITDRFGRTATATVAITIDPSPPVNPPNPNPPTRQTPLVPPALPRTGGETANLLSLALQLLVVGAALSLLARRRVTCALRPRKVVQMRRFMVVASVVVIAAGLSACGSSSKTSSPTSTTPAATGPCGSATVPAEAASFKPAVADTLSVVTSLPGPGFMNTSNSSPTDVTSGYEYDIAKCMESDFGLHKLTIRNVGFDAIVAGTVTKYDLALSQISITPERAKVLSFSTSYFESQQGILMRKGGTVTTLADAKKVKWGVQSATTAIDLLKKIGVTTPRSYQSLADAYTALQAKQVDAVLIDTAINLGQAARSNGELQVPAQFNQPGGPDHYGAALPKDSPNLAAVNGVFKSLKDSGELAKLVIKDLTADPGTIPVIQVP